MFTAIDHPAIACDDVEALAQWYCDVLGMRVIKRSAEPPLAVMVGYGDTLNGLSTIELMPVREPGPKPLQTTRFQPGLRHLALRVTDFDAAYAKLKAVGVEFLFEPGQAIGGGKVVSFRDPEGNELQIVERK